MSDVLIVQIIVLPIVQKDVHQNVKDKHLRVVQVVTMDVQANALKNVLQSVKDRHHRVVQAVTIVVQANALKNVLQSVKDRHHRVVQTVITVVIQVVLPDVRTLVIWDATQNAQAIVQTHAKQDVKQDATTPVAALVHT